MRGRAVRMQTYCQADQTTALLDVLCAHASLCLSLQDIKALTTYTACAVICSQSSSYASAELTHTSQNADNFRLSSPYRCCATKSRPSYCQPRVGCIDSGRRSSRHVDPWTACSRLSVCHANEPPRECSCRLTDNMDRVAVLACPDSSPVLQRHIASSLAN